MNFDFSLYYDFFPNELKKLKEHYAEANLNGFRIKDDIVSEPYKVMIEYGRISFKRADSLITTKNITMLNSRQRCQYACYSILSDIESAGSTRMSDRGLADALHKLAPQCMEHIVDVVNNDTTIYYNKERHLVSLSTTYRQENHIANHIKYRLEHSKPSGMDWTKYDTVDNKPLTDEQKCVLKVVSENDVCALTAAGGTGKSFTTNAVIQMLDDNNKSYTLLAPTGIAAKVLSKNTGRQATTIHKFIFNDSCSGEYVIIDEMSMVSVNLLSLLLTAVGYDSKLVFIADEAQLAAIQFGNIIQDIVDSNIVPHATLTKVFRYGEGGISTISTDMRKGSIEHLTDKFDDYEFIPIKQTAVQQAVEQYDKLIKSGYTQDDIVVLCPYNKSDIGSVVINRAISNKYNPNATVRKNSDIKIGSRVINIVNDYSDSDNFIANGDIGIVQSYHYTRADGSIIGVDFDSGHHFIDSLSKLLLAYSLSIHKSQGSQHKAVIVVIDKSHEWLISRNLIYVACSRAQEKLIMISDANVIKNGLSVVQNKNRNTWLKELLLDKSK